jgi:hypothetical protein
VARRTARRLIDVAFLAAIVMCIAMARPPSIPETVCRSSRAAPRYDALYADGKLTIAVVLAELDGQPPGLRDWSHARLVRALRERGFVETQPNRFARGEVTIDITLVFRVHDELTHAIASYDVVYYNGHSERGELAIEAGDGYRIVVLDSCWTTQLYSARLVDANRDVISNTDRSITGSIESFVIVLDGLVERHRWDRVLATLNARAAARASRRPMYWAPEEYRLDASCD